MPHDVIMCPQLQALLAQQSDGPNAVELDHAIEQHLVSCAVCAPCEQALTLLLAEYRHAAPPLNEALEHRLVDQLCRDRVS